MADVTQILSQIESGDPSAAEELLLLGSTKFSIVLPMPISNSTAWRGGPVQVSRQW